MRDDGRLIRWALATAVVLLTFVTPLSAVAQDSHGAHRAAPGPGVHGQGHDSLHHWYLTLKQPGTQISCCNDQDCRPTVSRVIDGVTQVQIDGEWANVPPEKS